MKKTKKTAICCFTITALIFTLFIQSFAAMGGIIDTGEAKWDVAFFTEEHIYIADNISYKYIKETVNLEYHAYIADKHGNELSLDDKISTGNKFILTDMNEELFTFVVLGDINRDGMVTSADARKALLISAKLVSPEDFLDYASADVDNSYKIDAADAREILRYAAKLTNYENFSKNKLQYYVYMDQAYLSVIINGDIQAMNDLTLPEKYDESLVEKVYIVSCNDNYASIMLKLKNPGRDNIDKLIYKLSKNDDFYISVPVDHIFRR